MLYLLFRIAWRGHSRILYLAMIRKQKSSLQPHHRTSCLHCVGEDDDGESVSNGVSKSVGSAGTFFARRHFFAHLLTHFRNYSLTLVITADAKCMVCAKDDSPTSSSSGTDSNVGSGSSVPALLRCSNCPCPRVCHLLCSPHAARALSSDGTTPAHISPIAWRCPECVAHPNSAIAALIAATAESVATDTVKMSATDDAATSAPSAATMSASTAHPHGRPSTSASGVASAGVDQRDTSSLGISASSASKDPRSTQPRTAPKRAPSSRSDSSGGSATPSSAKRHRSDASCSSSSSSSTAAAAAAGAGAAAATDNVCGEADHAKGRVHEGEEDGEEEEDESDKRPARRSSRRERAGRLAPVAPQRVADTATVTNLLVVPQHAYCRALVMLCPTFCRMGYAVIAFSHAYKFRTFNIGLNCLWCFAKVLSESFRPEFSECLADVKTLLSTPPSVEGASSQNHVAPSGVDLGVSSLQGITSRRCASSFGLFVSFFFQGVLLTYLTCIFSRHEHVSHVYLELLSVIINIIILIPVSSYLTES